MAITIARIRAHLQRERGGAPLRRSALAILCPSASPGHVARGRAIIRARYGTGPHPMPQGRGPTSVLVSRNCRAGALSRGPVLYPEQLHEWLAVRLERRVCYVGPVIDLKN